MRTSLFSLSYPATRVVRNTHHNVDYFDNFVTMFRNIKLIRTIQINGFFERLIYSKIPNKLV